MKPSHGLSRRRPQQAHAPPRAPTSGAGARHRDAEPLARDSAPPRRRCRAARSTSARRSRRSANPADAEPIPTQWWRSRCAWARRGRRRSRMYSRNNNGRPSEPHRDHCRGHTQGRERDEREQHDEVANSNGRRDRCGSCGKIEWPTTVGKGAHPVGPYARSRNHDGPFPGFSSKVTADPQNSPAGTSVWQTRHSIVAGASRSGSLIAVTLCRIRMLRTRLSTSVCRGPSPGRSQGAASATALPPRITSGSPAAASPRRPVQQGIEVPESAPAVGDEPFVIHRRHSGPDRRRLGSAAADQLLAVEDDLDAGELVGDRGDVGGEPAIRILIRQHRTLPRRSLEERGHPPPLPATAARRTTPVQDATPAASVDNVVPPTSVISGSEATRSSPISASLGGDDQSRPPLRSRPARSPLTSKPLCQLACASAIAAAPAQIGRGEQLVATPADREAPRRAGNCGRPTPASARNLRSTPPSPSTGRPRVDHHLLARAGATAWATSRSIVRCSPWGSPA